MPTYVFKGRNKLNEIIVGDTFTDDDLVEFVAALEYVSRHS